MNIIKIVLSLLVLAVGYLAWQFQSQAGLIADQERQIQALIASNQVPLASLDTQERCAKQSSAAFKQLGWDKNPSAAFANHFNARLGRCFMEVESTTMTGAVGWNNKTLFDAFEGRVIGSYAWHSDPVKKYWEVPPVTCEVTLPSGEKTKCKSDEEFEQLAKSYLE